jgi:transposase
MSEAEKGRPLLQAVSREQMCWRAVDVERLIAEDHGARAIWELVGRLDLRGYHDGVGSNEKEGGRPAFDPQLLISLWVYAYSVGIGSAREIARRCEWDPAFQWLTGCAMVNYHTLADFRVARRAELDELFTQVLSLLSAEGLIPLQQVMQDGTKIRALASGKSFRRRCALHEHRERVREYVQQIGDCEGELPRVAAARQRAVRERQQRLEHAAAEMEKLGAGAAEPKVSISDPEARIMKQPDGGFAPSYNVQVSADAAHSLIIGIEVVQKGNDRQQLLPALDRIEQRLRRAPRQMVADGDYTTRANLEAMAQRGVDYLGTLRAEEVRSGPGRLPLHRFVYDPQQDCYLCPQGKRLSRDGTRKDKSVAYQLYRARWKDCQGCPQKPDCCASNQSKGRSLMRAEPSPAVEAFRQKMDSAEAQAQYRKRSQVVEFCHAWIKSKLGLRQFHVRGLLKTRAEILWAALTYNIQQWIRIRRTALLQPN